MCLIDGLSSDIYVPLAVVIPVTPADWVKLNGGGGGSWRPWIRAMWAGSFQMVTNFEKKVRFCSKTTKIFDLEQNDPF